ncbi:MAG: MMPL family transporter [Thermoleophilia bacterium]|nr:MMPL family transporter [Thermoleophilia bacterium]
MARWLYSLGMKEATHPIVVLIVWVAVVVAAVGAVGIVGAQTNNDQSLPGTGSQEAVDLLEKSFSPQQNGTSPIVFHVGDGKLTDAANKKAIDASFEAIKKQPHVYSAVNPLTQEGQGYLSKDQRTAFIPVLMDVSSGALTEEMAARVLAAAQPGRAAGMEVAAGGPIGSALSQPATETSELVGLTFAMVILALTFGTLVAMGMPIMSAIIGLVVGLSLVGLAGHLFSIPSVGTTIAIMIGLGVGIDYALFIVSGRRANLADAVPVRESIARTVAGTGSAVLFAATTVIIALLALSVAGIPLVASLGYAAAIAVFTAVAAAITLLPAVLSLLGAHVESLKLPAFLRGRRHEGPGVWGRWASWVTGHPVWALGVALVIMIPLAVPVTSLTLGQEDIGVTPTSTTERQAFDLISAGFGPGYNGPLLVATSLTPAAQQSATYTKQYDEATSLQKSIDAQQKSLQQQADTLQSQQASLERKQAQLLSEKKALQSKQAKLAAQRADLRRQADSLAAKLRPLVRQLAELRLREARLERAIDRSTNPARTASLRVRLGKTRDQEAVVRAELAPLTSQAQVLAGESRTLAAQSASLAAQAAKLAAQAAALKAQAAALQQQANELQQQKQALQQQADEAKKLQKELTKELTMAGGDPRGTDPRIVKLQDALATPAGVALVSPPSINNSGDTTILSVIATTRPADPKTADLVRQLRSSVIPGATGAGVVAYVGGSTAANVDLAVLITARLPLVIVTVLALSFLLLMLATRSLLVPLQAALTNMLSVAASFGVLTAVFQWGWGLSLVGLANPYGTVPIASYVPLMMFAVLFGLSMDYEVFLVSQIEEQRAAGPDAREAIRGGLARSARVITAAGLIMITVFGSFVLNGDPVIKQFGVGLSVAVLLAAGMTLLLAPAVLVLFRGGLWWLPRALGRVLPHLGLDEDGSTPPRPGAEPAPAFAQAAAGLAGAPSGAGSPEAKAAGLDASEETTASDEGALTPG